MGLKKKKLKEGQTRLYITRGQAIKRLQVSLKEFQRLCILKGVYPRDVARGGAFATKGVNRSYIKTNKLYYHIADITYLASGDLLAKLREMRVFVKKRKKLKHKRQLYDARCIEEKKPVYPLKQVIKERHPTLIHAIQNLDDALSTLSAIAGIPGDEKARVPASIVRKCSKLINNFYSLITYLQAVKLGFISIKGYYIQAELLNTHVTWLIPHEFPQPLPGEVDFKVMLTFVEYYETLVRLVLEKLYSMSGLLYPPKYKAEIPFFITVKHEQNRITETPEIVRSKGIFSGLTFFIYREVPLIPIALVIMGAGGDVGFQGRGSPIEEDDSAITHRIVDRALNNFKFQTSSEVIQPQYVFDSLNSQQLLPIREYLPGSTLPPHLSPFEEKEDDEIFEIDSLAKSMLPKKYRRLISKIEYKQAQRKGK